MPHYDAQPGRESPPDADLSPAQLEADEVDLLRGLNGVAKIVAGARGVSELLSDVAEFALQAIPGVDGAGVTLIDPEHGIAGARVWAATPQFVRDIDDLQYEVLNEGPCVTCMRTHRPTVSGSIGSDERWPHFRGHVARMGVHSVLALPLMIADQVIGAINAYAYYATRSPSMRSSWVRSSPGPPRYRCTTHSCSRRPRSAPIGSNGR